MVKNGVTSEFTYGCDGLRRRSVVTQANGEQMRTDYVLDGQSVVQEVVTHRANANASWGNTTTVSYLQGPSGPLYRHVSGTTDVSWYVYDRLGSVVGEVDVTGGTAKTAWLAILLGFLLRWNCMKIAVPSFFFAKG